jgi:excisionase family DNA binding protein
MSTTAVGPRLVLTVEEAAERLGIGRTLMYALVKAGVVESICIGRLRRIPVDALEEYVEQLRSALSTSSAQVDARQSNPSSK